VVAFVLILMFGCASNEYTITIQTTSLASNIDRQYLRQSDSCQPHDWILEPMPCSHCMNLVVAVATLHSVVSSLMDSNI
jgi:hypothetical protein